MVMIYYWLQKKYPYFNTAVVLVAGGVALPQNKYILYGQKSKNCAKITQDTSDWAYLLKGLRICPT